MPGKLILAKVKNEEKNGREIRHGAESSCSQDPWSGVMGTGPRKKGGGQNQGDLRRTAVILFYRIEEVCFILQQV